jgi:hypothetical protein
MVVCCVGTSLLECWLNAVGRGAWAVSRPWMGPMAPVRGL